MIHVIDLFDTKQIYKKQVVDGGFGNDGGV